MAIMEGPLSKWTNVMKGWQYRWFVLDENSGLLSYYTSKEKMMRGARRGCVRLKGAVIGIDDEDDSTFTLTVDQKTFHFQARDADEKERWIDALENTILRHSQPIARWERQPVPSMNEFDRKLAETDAYLQILIEQVKDLDDRISRCDDDESRSKLNLIKEAAENMIESIKQSIVLLQITKYQITEKQSSQQNVSTRTVISPANNTDEGIQNDFVILDVPRQIDDAGSTENSHQGKLNGAAISKRGLGAQCAVSEVTSSNHLAAVAAAASGAVPDSSYSSSEDEDFVDAEEYTSDHVNGVEEEPPLPPKIIASQDDYFDELYDNIEEEDLGTLEGHGSMITHLLSQVRIGMDLTKVVLPTFILEKRSLLEMFADFFAHPDIFVGIVDQPTPRDRMVQAVRWYLSAFHAGRRTHVAKKPYNPIIGETFRCYYDVPNVPPEQEKYNDGPIPWSTKSNVSFLAEQVSHHPPISAFYAECAKKRISMDGYIWTKSKFLGLSIGVHMIGQGHIAVPDHDEDYIITFPNAYGRSILTIPWMELGGKVGVNCPKTGYYANIEFLTKPFYGGKKDQVTAEIFAPNEKKPFCTIKGEWNGVMWAKYDTGMNEIFVDTKNMPVIKKRVLPIEQQEEFESRRLWRDVTYNLKVKNIEAATNFKHKLEQRQREEARIRKEQGAKWETKQFHEVGEHWVYDRTLVKRLNKAAAMTKEELLIDYENPEQPQ